MKKIFIVSTLITFAFISCKKDKDKPASIVPTVKTAAITNLGAGNVMAGGSIVSDGGSTISQSGVVWSKTNTTPTLTDTVVAATATTGAFTVSISNIDFGNTYYFRAFATNSTGTGYGDVVTLTTSNDSVRFTYNGQSVTYGIIVSPVTGRKWLDRNLGAQQVATAYNDYKAYGDLFQWGRPADGHQLMNWTASNAGTRVNSGITQTLATSDTPGHNNFIDASSNVAEDWRSDNNLNRWATNPQGPCPTGWHVPTIVEWRTEMYKDLVNPEQGGTSGGMTDLIEAFTQLKLTSSGYIWGTGPTAGNVAGMASDNSTAGQFGNYWSSTHRILDGAYSGTWLITLSKTSVFKNLLSIASGMSVRCIKD